MTAEEFKILYPSLPGEPGVYRFIGRENKLLYVGKAKNLNHRVASYFNKNQTAKTTMMVKQAAAIQYTIVPTEQDALLLENELIKQFQPKYNINLRDDKTYPWIVIRNEEYPRIEFTRRPADDGSEYFGPYTSVHKVRGILDFVKRMYPIRNCSFHLSAKNISAGKFKVCLEFHLGNCKGPCEGRQSRGEYDAGIENIRQVLKGKTGEVIRRLKLEMQACSAEMKFEEAEKFRAKIELLADYQSRSLVVHPSLTNVDVFSFQRKENRAFINGMHLENGIVVNIHTLEAVSRLDETDEELLQAASLELRLMMKSYAPEIIVPLQVSIPQAITTVPVKGDKKKLLDLSQKNLESFILSKLTLPHKKSKEEKSAEILKRLQQDFHLKELPVHIECFDNSNFQGSNAVAAMVCFRNGIPSKKDYRRFHIQSVTGPDDFASMREIVHRRYSRLINEKLALPQLVLIDGGKGQLHAATDALAELNLLGTMTVCSIAKKLEEIFFPGDSLPLFLDKKSPSLRLLQQIRNEAHRFAITFHRQKRSRKAVTSELQTIPGIAQATADKLLRQFRSMEKLKLASEEELISTVGKSKAKKILDWLKK